MGQDESQNTLVQIETEITVLMRRAEASRRATAVAPHRALDRAAYLILRQLDEHGPQSVNGIAQALSLDGSTVTRQVTAMERDGLVTRARDVSDGRVIMVEPTRSGRNRMNMVRRARRELYRDILADWSDDDRRDLARLLTALNASISRHMSRRD